MIELKWQCDIQENIQMKGGADNQQTQLAQPTENTFTAQPYTPTIQAQPVMNTPKPGGKPVNQTGINNTNTIGNLNQTTIGDGSTTEVSTGQNNFMPLPNFTNPAPAFAAQPAPPEQPVPTADTPTGGKRTNRDQGLSNVQQAEPTTPVEQILSAPVEQAMEDVQQIGLQGGGGLGGKMPFWMALRKYNEGRGT